MDNGRLFKRVVWALTALIVALFVFVTFFITRPDTYEDHLEQPVTLSKSAWPDGSPRTANDWWAEPNATPQSNSPSTAKAPGSGAGSE
jgi:hypothetical protein